MHSRARSWGLSSTPSDWLDTNASRPVSVGSDEEKMNWYDWLRQEIENDDVAIKIKVVKSKRLVKGKCYCKIPNFTCGCDGTWVYPSTQSISAKLENDKDWVPCKALILKTNDTLLQKLNVYRSSLTELENFGVNLHNDVERSIKNTDTAISEMNKRRLNVGLDAVFVVAPERPDVEAKYFEKFIFKAIALDGQQKVKSFDWLRNEITNRRLTIKLRSKTQINRSGECACPSTDCLGKWMHPKSLSVWPVLTDVPDWIPCLELIRVMQSELKIRLKRYQIRECLLWYYGIDVPQQKALDKWNVESVLKLAMERRASASTRRLDKVY